MLADKKDSNSYIAEMGQEVRPLEGDDIQLEVEKLVASIEAEFTMDRLNDFVRNGGFAPDSRSGPAGDDEAHLESNNTSAESASGPAGDDEAHLESNNTSAESASGPAGDDETDPDNSSETETS